MKPIPVGVQLYSVREDCARDLPGTLAAIKKMGYVGVEFAGYYGRPALELRKLLDDLSLSCCGTHIGLDTLLGDNLPRTIEFNQALGNKYLVVPSLPKERRENKAGWLATAALFNELAEKVKPHGMQVGYHNHHEEFRLMNGEMEFDIFFGATRQEVNMQFDTGNALHGGADPLTFLKRYPRRGTTIHLKEYSAGNPQALIGEGDIEWLQVFSLVEAAGGTDWYIVEQESYPVSPLESIARCRQALVKLGR